VAAAVFFGCIGVYGVHGGIQAHLHPAVLPFVGLERLPPYALPDGILADA
jgi:hypothetical protein